MKDAKFSILFVLIFFTPIFFSHIPLAQASLGDWAVGAQQTCRDMGAPTAKQVDIQTLIDCFRPASVERGQTSNLAQLQGDVEAIRQKTELWLYMLNASEKIMANAAKNKNKLLQLSEALKGDKWNENELLIDQQNSFQMMIALHKGRKVHEFYQEACTKERLKNQPYCAKMATSEYQQNMEIIQQQLEAIPLQNPLLFDSTIREKIDELSDLSKEERKGLVKDQPINPFAGQEEHQNIFRREFPSLLARAQKANDNTIARHPSVLAKNKTVVDLENFLSNQKLINDYLATNYHPRPIFLTDANQNTLIADLPYAYCRIILQHSVNNLNQVFLSAGLDLGMIVATFGVAGVARMIIANAPKVAALFANNVHTARGLYYGSEAAIAATEAARVLEQNKECQELIELAVLDPEGAKNLTEELKDCQDLVSMQGISLGIAALGAVVGIKFSQIDIVQFRLERANRLGKGKLLSSIAKGKSLANNLPTSLAREANEEADAKVATALEQIWSDTRLVADIEERFAELLKNLSPEGDEKKYVIGILARLQEQIKEKNPKINPKELQEKVAQEFAERSKLCRTGT